MPSIRCLFLLPLTALALPASEAAPPTFYKDVLPVLEAHCQGCHRPGEIGPMPLLTYKQVRPYAASIRENVQLRKMPPWGADPAHGKFANDPSLSDKERQTLIDWVTARSPEGDPQEAPKPVAFTEGWNIGKPDLVFAMPKPYEIPAKGTVEYTYYVIPLNLKEDRWVSAAEVRPSNRSVVHHVIAYVRPPGSEWLKDVKPGEPYVPDKPYDQREGVPGRGEFLVGFAPGYGPRRLAPGQGKLLTAGSDIVLEVHYTANGTATSDQTRVGVVLAKETPQVRVMTVGAENGDFVIPPGAANHPVKSDITFYGDAEVVSYQPHMHVRGSSFRYDLIEASGAHQTLLNVPHYDFHWQHAYLPVKPLAVHAGTTIQCYATYDNSPGNPWNPDPKAEVRWGDQSWEEMMIGFMEIAFDAKLSPMDILVDPKDRPKTDASSK